MKKNYIVIVFAFTILSFTKGINAIDYNNSLVEIQEKTADEINFFMTYIVQEDFLSNIEFSKTILDSIKENIVTNIAISKEKIKKIGFFKNDSNLNISLLSVLDAYHMGCGNEYYEIGLYNLLPKEKQTDKLHIEVQSSAFLADSIINIAEDAFIKAQINFANEHNLEFEETPN